MEPSEQTQEKSSLRLIAFYLPQFHPIPENNVWWGNGYTEWTNVARAKPLFPGHYQPQLPADLGFYDLRLPEARQAQADLARAHGIHGFCHYHYWFNGRRVLERPFDEVLESGQPDFPFCLGWANHTWTWKRDHNMQGRLLDQEYSREDDREHIRWLLNVFQDERYIRVNGRPLFLIYWAHSLPDPQRTFSIWREEAEKAGEAEPYICKVDSFGNFDNPHNFGCDAAVEFWPHAIENMIHRVTGPEEFYKENRIFEYRQFILAHLARKKPDDFKRFRCVLPRWDNTARWKSSGALVLRGSTPELYGAWLESVIRETTSTFELGEQLVFINAWNEWGEGAYLEPDIKYGRAYLEANQQALVNTAAEIPSISSAQEAASAPASAEKRYSQLLEKYEDLQRRFSEHMGFEERSPLVQKAEGRYDELLSNHNQLRQKHRILTRKHENLRKRFTDVEDKLVRRSAAQQQFKSEQLQFKSERQRLKSEQQQFKSERQRLKSERQQFKSERQQLKSEQQQFKSERQRLKSEQQQVENARRQIEKHARLIHRLERLKRVISSVLGPRGTRIARALQRAPEGKRSGPMTKS